jgi:ATP-dependent exoDNAse (exonuclease V) beta subunit
LYVACTRAKRGLHLLAHAAFDARSGTPVAPPRSLAALLWPAIGEAFAALAPAVATAEETTAPSPPPFRRLPADWTPPALPARHWPAAATDDGQVVAPPIEFDWASETARHVGTLVHRWLERIGRSGLDAWSPDRLLRVTASFGPALRQLGVPDDRLAEGAARVRDALARTLADPRGRWILEAHPHARCELGLAVPGPAGSLHLTIDRTFVDREGVRWIVDYKTSAHQGGDLDEFLDREQARYGPQLQRYAAALRQLEDRPIRLGLYFPLLAAWRSWDA